MDCCPWFLGTHPYTKVQSIPRQASPTSNKKRQRQRQQRRHKKQKPDDDKKDPEPDMKIGLAPDHTVFRVFDPQARVYRARKYIPLGGSTGFFSSGNLRELYVAMLLSQTTDHILSAVSYEVDHKEKQIVMYMPLGHQALHSFLFSNEDNNKRSWDINQLWSYVRQFLSGLDGFHRNQLAHLDLKPANILLMDEQNKKLMIADFGTVVSQWASHHRDEGDIGTVGYQAPDNLWTFDYLKATFDMFTFGIVLAEMLDVYITNATKTRRRPAFIHNNCDSKMNATMALMNAVHAFVTDDQSIWDEKLSSSFVDELFREKKEFHMNRVEDKQKISLPPRYETPQEKQNLISWFSSFMGLEAALFQSDVVQRRVRLEQVHRLMGLVFYCVQPDWDQRVQNAGEAARYLGIELLNRRHRDPALLALEETQLNGVAPTSKSAFIQDEKLIHAKVLKSAEVLRSSISEPSDNEQALHVASLILMWAWLSQDSVSFDRLCDRLRTEAHVSESELMDAISQLLHGRVVV